MRKITVAFFVMAYCCVAATGNPASQLMSIDVKDTEIRDVIRMISRGYDINIILDNEIEGKVTLCLTDVPIMEGLRTLAASSGLDVKLDGTVYRIKKGSGNSHLQIEYNQGKLSIDASNVSVVEFVKEVSVKTGANIVADGGISGTVSGKLNNVPFEDGFKAVLNGNGYWVDKKKNIYTVKMTERRGRDDGRQAATSQFFVEYVNGLVSIDVMDVELGVVLDEIVKQGDIQLVSYGRIQERVNAKLKAIPLVEALALLLGGTQYTFIEKNNVLLIGDRNSASPSGKVLSTAELVHLKHIKADDVPSILPNNIQSGNVKVVKEQNALLVSGTSEDIVATQEFLKRVDIATPQVIIDAIVVEYSRNQQRDFGLLLGTDPSGKSGANSYAFPSLSYNAKGEKARNVLSELFPKFRIISNLTDDFYLSLKMLEDQGKARVLAQPSITVLNGNNASINVGQTQYFKIVTGTQDNQTYRFEPISFGIKLSITPWIAESGQITAVITPEISNAMGVNSEGYPNVFTRQVNTTVRLESGQTLVLGGLLRTEEQVTKSQVPILGDIPIVGHFFSNTRKNSVQTNLVLYITPHILKTGSEIKLSNEMQKLNERDRQGFSSDIFNQYIERQDSVWVEIPKKRRGIFKNARKEKLKNENENRQEDTLSAPKSTLGSQDEFEKSMPNTDVSQPAKQGVTDSSGVSKAEIPVSSGQTRDTLSNIEER